ncbi:MULTISPECIES: PLP-dependent aminotransferase family protein [Streptomyces]|uniref:PLP-dependent aminotransferase family protein n=2 Tax=Streptomyces caniscabiei TaxID=2746961 RepID=A0ABU4MHE6_9ACTN|nr:MULTISPECIES: PLP-dependent aminotransferase family protein [Streptomyces]MBE4736094.1 PLP-dependent aminotransferase family protein [Streptomyces caniscabiei]MBE4755778.1 PLP-dependent aminotransferase family protein [Streptomyces caniscabiei]MBE4771634.1 PLP-dependent aminotransferase family protein [Streptomyces caniscabiei]MBE4785939.1 PLP-dependent aminotransferase family protein [Streptomyces caniscabiei]MBE4793960.1 PLP-dependent aminotransferase family protein [Streptomyces caniscab
MADSWVNSAGSIGADLHLELSGGGGRRAALIRALRDAVRGGRLAPGTRLPPYRSLAADLGVARNTVADAYAELVAEGWLTARQGSGTRVAERVEPLGGTARGPRRAPPRARGPRHDLRQGTPDASAFPRTAWAASYRRALTRAPNEAFGPGDPAGRVELREALAEYLARARGVRTEPSRIVVCSGFAHALRLLFHDRVLRGPLAVESYGLGFHRELLAAASVRTVPLALDEDGARVDGLDRERAVLLTPAHQFPTGGPLHPERRAAVVDWARARGGLVLEDDYDGEFRYDRKPVGAVQGLDPDRVVHLGSVSKSLSPALRLGWMVLPERFVDAVLEAKGEREAWASVPDQLALADFMVSGAYDRHVRRMRQRYRARRDRLVAALAAHAPHIEVTGIAAGLHAVLRLPPGTERSAVKAAAWRGVALDGLSAFRHPEARGDAPDGLVVGYATPPEHAYGAAVEALCGVLPPE